MHLIISIVIVFCALNAQAQDGAGGSGTPITAIKAPALDLSAVGTLEEIIEKVSHKRIVYVGEIHVKYSHHLVQLEIIRALAKSSDKLAVGLEMFQAPYQQVLDEYVKGTIDERTFLKRSGYFTRWGFDYLLYKPIIDFARSSGIPLVALNARRELTEKVSRGGIDSLSPEERREVPDGMDLGDEDYRKRLKESFDAHRTLKEGNFDFFVQSQVLWDETMADRIVAFMRAHDDYRMVVLAGNGHLAYGSGIPKRVANRQELSSAIILCDAEVSPGIAEYLVFPADTEPPRTPRLMVLLKEDKGRVTISEFPHDSIGERAGLRPGDVIEALDTIPVTSGDDVRIHMLGKKKGDSVTVRVLRKRFLFGEKTVNVNVPL